MRSFIFCFAKSYIIFAFINSQSEYNLAYAKYNCRRQYNSPKANIAVLKAKNSHECGSDFFNALSFRCTVYIVQYRCKSCILCGFVLPKLNIVAKSLCCFIKCCTKFAPKFLRYIYSDCLMLFAILLNEAFNCFSASSSLRICSH